MLALDRRGNINLEALKNVSEPFVKPIHTRKDGMKYEPFFQSLDGVDGSKFSNIETPIGKVVVNIYSQFWKMLRCKERRADVLMNINTTLKNPLLVAECEGSIFFFKSFEKPNGKLFCMVSVCTLDEKKECLILKTNYQMRSLKKVAKILSSSMGKIMYDPYKEDRKEARKQRRANRRKKISY